MARKSTTSSRLRGVGLVLAGLMIGGMLIGTATAHNEPGAKHKHILKVVNNRHYTKAQSNGRYYTKAQIDTGATGCPGNGPDDVMVKVGPVCIDRYENSIWTAPTGGTQITGAIPCAADGQDCNGKIFARSVPGVTPRVSITWFQAQAALANSGKRLPANAEWQMAVTGTPDHPGPCNTASAGPVDTGSAAGCVSSWGANDMVGNVWEWVADWMPRSTCPGSWGAFSDDSQGFCGAATTDGPGALMRGGRWNDGTFAGPFAVNAAFDPSRSDNRIGFRGAR